MQTSKPALELLTSDAIYRENPTALFHQLCGARPATLLLESADIDSKDDLKSLLLVDSALRITALGDTVTIQALSANGAALLELLDGALPSGINNQRQPNGRILTFPAVSALLDEDARLCSLSVFDAFRLLQELVSVPDNEREAMFFGGLFAYDPWPVLKIFPSCKATPPARTTASIWRKPCWSSTIRPSIPAFRPACSPRWRVKNSARAAPEPVASAAERAAGAATGYHRGRNALRR